MDLPQGNLNNGNLNHGNFNFVSFILNGLSNELNNELNNENSSSNEPKRSSKDFIDSLEEIEIKEIKEKGKTCHLCLEDFKIGDKCIELPCKDHKHLFHTEKEGCMGIKKWLEKSNTCPVCRTEFPHEEQMEQEEQGGQEIEINLNEIDNRMRQLMGQILNNNIRILSPQEVIEMEEQRQLEAAIQASLDEQ